jgi:hypothetical protein
MRSVMLLVLMNLSMSAAATTVVVDFERLYDSGEDTNYSNTDQGQTYFEDGMRVRNISGGFGLSTWVADAPAYTGSTAMFNNTRNGTIDLRATNGEVFDLISIDLAPLHGSFSFTGPEPAPAEHVYVTFLTDTGHSQTFDVGITDGGWVYDEYYEVWRTTVPPPVTTFYFDAGFQGVNWVQWVQEDPGLHQFDNITANVVPVPAAMWLFASALAGLGCFRQRYPRTSVEK